jgi:HTH-type transcriptional regulator / antitoxin HipB
MNLAETTKKRRKLLKISQEELALLSGCSRQLVVEIEKGKTTIRFDKLVAILTALGLQLVLEEHNAHDEYRR